MPLYKVGLKTLVFMSSLAGFSYGAPLACSGCPLFIFANSEISSWVGTPLLDGLEG